MTGLAVRREDIGVEEHYDRTLSQLSISVQKPGALEFTVMTTPVSIILRWNDFCVVLATFFRVLN